VIDETVLLESRSLRDSVLDRTDVLDRVKALSLLPDGMHVTTAMVAAYFEVGIEAIKSVVKDHRAELEASGYRLLTGTELRFFKDLSGIQSRTRSLALFPRRAVLNIAMLLRDSKVARQVRVYLLDMEYLARTQPVENPVLSPQTSLSTQSPLSTPPAAPPGLDERIDGRIAHILGKTVVPMFNALIASCGEHRQELITLRQDIENVERRLCRHHRRIRALETDAPAARVGASLRAMTRQALAHHVAGLLRRDGCTDVTVRTARTDRGVDITARTADGRTVAVRCKNRAGRSTVPSADLRKFAGATRVVGRVDVALFVAPCVFSGEAQAVADLTGVITVGRDELEAWTAGVRLKALQ
jgi:hypothetical protein